MNTQNISPSIGKHGRSDEEMNPDGQPPAKRRKLNGEAELAGRTFSFTYIPEDCVKNILQFFSVKDLLVFEQIEKGMSRGITSYRWKEICEHKGYNCTWSDLAEYPESSQDKMRYLGNVVLLRLKRTYLSSNAQFWSDLIKLVSRENKLEEIKTRYFSFYSWLIRFPALQAYIYHDLKLDATCLSFSDSEIEFSIGDNKYLKCKDIKDEDILLKSLLLIKLSTKMNLFSLSSNFREDKERAGQYEAREREVIEEAEKCLTQAIITERMTGASVLTSALIKNQESRHPELKQMALRLAKLSITQNDAQDYRGLHELLMDEESFDTVPVFEEIKDYESRLRHAHAPEWEQAAMACCTEDKFKQAEELFKKAIEAYGEKVLPQTWENLCHFKIAWAIRNEESEHLEEATGYKNRAIAAWEEDKEGCYLFLKKIADDMLDYVNYLIDECQREFVNNCVKELVRLCPDKRSLRQEWKNRLINLINTKDNEQRILNLKHFLLNTYDEKEEIPARLILLQIWLEYAKTQERESSMKEGEEYAELALNLFNQVETAHKDEMETMFEAVLIRGIIHGECFESHEQAKFFLNQAKEMMVGETFFEGVCSRKEIEDDINTFLTKYED